MLHCFQLVNTPAPGILSCLITTAARLVCLPNARVAPAAQDNFTEDISPSFYFTTAITTQCAPLHYVFRWDGYRYPKYRSRPSAHLKHTLLCCGLPMPPRLAWGVTPRPCSGCPVTVFAMVTFLWGPWLGCDGVRAPCCCAGPLASGPFPPWMQMMGDNTNLAPQTKFRLLSAYSGKLSSLRTTGRHARPHPQSKLKMCRIPIRQPVEKKKKKNDHPNKVMVSLSNKVTAQLCRHAGRN